MVLGHGVVQVGPGSPILLFHAVVLASNHRCTEHVECEQSERLRAVIFYKTRAPGTLLFPLVYPQP